MSQLLTTGGLLDQSTTNHIKTSSSPTWLFSTAEHTSPSTTASRTQRSSYQRRQTEQCPESTYVYSGMNIFLAIFQIFPSPLLKKTRKWRRKKIFQKKGKPFLFKSHGKILAYVSAFSFFSFSKSRPSWSAHRGAPTHRGVPILRGAHLS